MIASIALFLQAAREEVDLDAYRRPRAALVADYERACEAGVVLACDAARAPLRLETVGPSASLACENQDAAACVVTGWWEAATSKPGKRSERATQSALTRACSLSPAEGCAELARWELRQQELGEDGLAHAVAACEAGSAFGCTIAGLREESDEAALPRLRAACTGGRVDACVAVERLTGSAAQEDPQIRVACDIGFVPACLDLASHSVSDLERWCGQADVDACFTRAAIASDLPLVWTFRACLVSNVCAPFAGGVTGPIDIGLYDAACAKGDTLACDVATLARLEHRDARQAVVALLAQCRGGDGVACAFVADYTEVGWGVPQDASQAATDREAGCSAGVAYACPHHLPPRTPPWRQVVGDFPSRRSPGETDPFGSFEADVLVRPLPRFPRSIVVAASAIPHYEVTCVTRITAGPGGAMSSSYWVQCPVFLRETVRAALLTARWRPSSPPTAFQFDFRFVFRLR